MTGNANIGNSHPIHPLLARFSAGSCISCRISHWTSFIHYKTRNGGALRPISNITALILFIVTLFTESSRQAGRSAHARHLIGAVTVPGAGPLGFGGVPSGRLTAETFLNIKKLISVFAVCPWPDEG